VKKFTKIKNGFWLVEYCAKLYNYPFAQPFLNRLQQKANNELYIILVNSCTALAKIKGRLLKRAVQDLLEETRDNVNFSFVNQH
jgi:hypothetical protein